MRRCGAQRGSTSAGWFSQTSSWMQTRRTCRTSSAHSRFSTKTSATRLSQTSSRTSARSPPRASTSWLADRSPGLSRATPCSPLSDSAARPRRVGRCEPLKHTHALPSDAGFHVHIDKPLTFPGVLLENFLTKNVQAGPWEEGEGGLRFVGWSLGVPSGYPSHAAVPLPFR